LLLALLAGFFFSAFDLEKVVVRKGL